MLPSARWLPISSGDPPCAPQRVHDSTPPRRHEGVRQDERSGPGLRQWLGRVSLTGPRDQRVAHERRRMRFPCSILPSGRPLDALVGPRFGTQPALGCDVGFDPQHDDSEPEEPQDLEKPEHIPQPTQTRHQ
jgi:hypothetical protein